MWYGSIILAGIANEYDGIGGDSDSIVVQACAAQGAENFFLYVVGGGAVQTAVSGICDICCVAVSAGGAVAERVAAGDGHGIESSRLGGSAVISRTAGTAGYSAG